VQSDGYREPSWTRHTLGYLALERFGADSVLRINLFGGPERTQLAFLGVTNDYTSRPGAGVERLDTTYFTRFVLNWK